MDDDGREDELAATVTGANAAAAAPSSASFEAVSSSAARPRGSEDEEEIGATGGGDVGRGGAGCGLHTRQLALSFELAKFVQASAISAVLTTLGGGLWSQIGRQRAGRA